MKAEAVAHLLLSIIATAVIAGLVTVVGNEAFNQHIQFFAAWAVCFCMWWGIWYLGEC
ncbi:membrane protein [Streptomyces phage TunaTartare]|uniref:Membrane protein n=1 Tax=Streptomyces phage TunaTartare TaxID=2848887 RepID=A0A8F2IWL9_9CAUD|nr:membrane protein [Streptomyces phage TunaTartare]QWT30081.1 membrane protein [Streptomyces phage TunaTartare]